MHYPLSDAAGQILFKVRAERAEDRDDNHGQHRKVEDRRLIGADPTNDAGQPLRHSFRSKDVIENDLERPGLEEIGEAFTNHRDEGERKKGPVRIKQIGDANFLLHARLVSAWRVQSLSETQLESTGIKEIISSTDMDGYHR